MNKRLKMWIWIVLGGLAGLVALVFLVGSFLPNEYRATGMLELAMSPDELWDKLADVEKHPMSGRMCRGVEKLPQENGLAVWMEDMGSSKLRIRDVAAEKPSRLVREMADTVVPMKARTEIEIAPRDGGACAVRIDHRIELRSGTWHVPVFRVILTLFGGARSGMEAMFGQVTGQRRAKFAWE